jgi:methionyl-tRNA formyltransferase
MNIIFAGTPVFARVALEQLHAAGHDIALVLTQPDRPAGRGMKLQASPVKQFALDHGIALAQPQSLRLDGRYPLEAAAARQAIEAAQATAMVVAAYGLILPQWVLDTMTRGPGMLGCFNIHASLLPRWRGAAPIHRAIEAGDRATGVTIMQMDAGLDTGDMLLHEALPIGASETTAELHDRLATLGARLMVQALERAAAGDLQPRRQPETGVTYAHKIDKAEAAIDWTQPAQAIARRVRAFHPFPGAATALSGEAVKVWRAQAEDVEGPAGAVPGQILSTSAEGIRVQAGRHTVLLTELQRAGGKRLAVGEFLRGFAAAAGQVFDAAPAPAPDADQAGH